MALPKELTTVTPTSRIFTIIIMLFLPFIGFLLGIKYQTIVTNNWNQKNSIPVSYSMNNNEWITFKSDRGDFSFQHPANFPVTQCKSSLVFSFENRVEDIDFGKTCLPNSGEESYGKVIVETVPYRMSFEDILQKEYDKRYYTVSSEKRMIGTEEGYYVTVSNTPDGSKLGGTFGQNLGTYYILKNRFLYRIFLKSSVHRRADSDYIKTTFEKILSTFTIR